MGNELIVGVVAVLVGVVLCLWGRGALRALLAVWGAVLGFALGALLAHSIAGESGPAPAWTWVAGLIGAVVLAVLAGVFYSLAVAVAAGAIGFVLVSALASALGATGTTLTVLSLLGAVVFGALALALHLPSLLLVVLSALAGANIAVGGVAVIAGRATGEDLLAGQAVVSAGWGWWVAGLVLAAASIVLQLRRGRPGR